MKILLLFSICLLFSVKSFGFSMDLEYIRKHYEQAASDKELCQEMINDLSKIAPTSVHLVYLGALQTIWANHVIDPFSKLSTFKKGKATIEQAVKIDRDNVEIRFVRLSVQKNCPSFLGYNNNIKEDELFVKEHKEEVSSLSLMKLINTVLKK